MVEIIGFEEGERALSWPGLCEAFARGHALPRAEIADGFLYRGEDTLLNRAAWIDGLGLAVKSATVFPGNGARGKPAVNGGVCLYADTDGTLEAIVDFHLVTKWKTAGDSLFAATRLARPDSRKILVVGAGNVARSLVEAYRSAFPEATFTIWSRTEASARRLAEPLGAAVATDLEAAVQEADIVTSATMATEPLIRGEWLRPGQHVDLIGAYRPDMREADDRALQRARVFVDSCETVLTHIGELKTPIATGAIAQGDVVADYYDLGGGRFRRESDDEITLFKNGGGAHLDLMTSRYILDAWRAA
ncbi:ornithine cyclodeaminase [Rhodovulum sulfidophilum]|uniref:NAD(P)-binding domain-containing protein n=1 Tax=Rhodovulum visakhapatnamense TaxID=364297 RepID=A0ABS1RHS0_9RHOB|nr:NAD(P)-binding domain-containing protein [Rhodovulum visakhapatnamense]MBL3569492.1 NAD(P)-binding domain-containing protein [Rhodovulum visakhapatnamense]MBL3579064.1 NAD(P)-binding domain-containing protein [Rhodovulum visakhapatnamense]OLS43353.1 ornithine cyclodeaminase [Rhodovulum sulfidophilum]